MDDLSYPSNKNKGAVPGYSSRNVEDHRCCHVQGKEARSFVAALVGLVDNKVLVVYHDGDLILIECHVWDVARNGNVEPSIL